MTLYYDDLVLGGSQYKPQVFGQHAAPGWADDLVYAAQVFGGGPAPGALYDWPNPLTKGYAIALRSWIEPTKLNLIGQDKFFGAPGMGPVYDYPNPLIKRPAIGLRTWSNAQVHNFVSPNQVQTYDWPLPIPKRHAVSLRSWTHSYVHNYPPPPQVKTYDWQNPTRQKSRTVSISAEAWVWQPPNALYYPAPIINVCYAPVISIMGNGPWACASIMTNRAMPTQGVMANQVAVISEMCACGPGAAGDLC